MNKKIDVNISLKEINEYSKGSLFENLGIEIIELGEDFIVGKMPVDERTFQPMKRLHGGASVALMETVGSMGSHLIIDKNTHFAVGIEINANHVGAARNGFVIGTGKVVHLGAKTHVWQIDVRSEEGKLISTGRLTNMIIKIEK